MKLYAIICETKLGKDLNKYYEVFEAVDNTKALEITKKIKNDYMSYVWDKTYDLYEEFPSFWEEIERQCGELGINSKDWTVQFDNLMYDTYEKNTEYQLIELALDKLPTFNLDELTLDFKKNPEEFINKYMYSFFF